MRDVTEILEAASRGEKAATEELLPLLYDELRKLASDRLAKEKEGQTLQATALVHEVYLRLVGSDKGGAWANRAHFFAAASEAMRRIVIDRAREKQSLKRGGEWNRLGAQHVEIAISLPSEQLLEVNDALDRLTEEAPQSAEVAKLRYFAGLSLDDIASMLDISRRAATKHWVIARARLLEMLAEES